MNVLITGGAGFIGTHLTQLAAEQNHRVRVLDNLSPQIHGTTPTFSKELLEHAECIYGDVRNRIDLEKCLDGIEVVIHLAAETGMGQSQYEIFRYFDVNVNGTALILDILANSKHQVNRIILSSSGRVYGDGPYICPKHGKIYPKPRSKDDTTRNGWNFYCPECSTLLTPSPCLETDILQPTSMYAVTKTTQEQMLHLFGTLYGLETVVLRYQNVYGRGQALRNPYTGVLSVFCTRLRNGLIPEVYEDGCPTRDFVHVSDVAASTMAAIQTPNLSHQTINVGSGIDVTILQTAEALIQAFGVSVKPQVTGMFRAGDVRNMVADLTLARTLLGYSPKIGLEEGVRDLVAWVLSEPAEQDRSLNALAELGRRGLA